MDPTPTDTAQSLRCLAQDICGSLAQIIHRLRTNHLHQALGRRVRPRKRPRLSDGAWLKTAALHDATMEEPPGPARRKQSTDRLCSGRLPKNRDIVRISAKSPDVLRDPFENRKESNTAKFAPASGCARKPKTPKR